MNKGDVEMAKHFSNSTGTRDELSITLYLQSEINFCSVRMPSMPDATSLPPEPSSILYYLELN